jgi:serine protease Do
MQLTYLIVVRKMTRLALLASLLTLSLSLGAIAAAERRPASARRDQPLKEAVALQETFARVADQVFPSMVCLTSFERTAEPTPPTGAAQDRGFWREPVGVEQRYPNMRRLASASGFLMTADGYAVSSLDFLRKPGGELADLVDAETFDGTIALCEVVGIEPTLNLAVIKLALYPNAEPPVLAPVTIADPDAIRVGHWAIAVGDPLGPQRVFAAGLISARPERDCYQAELAATFLEASLQVHPEAHGGPLVDIEGAVMGIIVPHRTPQFDEASSGLVYALPMSIATGIFESLKVARSFESPWLGVSVLSLGEYRERLRASGTARDRKQPVMGVYIDNVFDPSPAALADVRVGDILLSVNAQRLFTVFDFQRSLYLAGIGNTIAIELYRDGEMLTRQVTIEARPAAANATTAN